MMIKMKRTKWPNYVLRKECRLCRPITTKTKIHNENSEFILLTNLLPGRKNALLKRREIWNWKKEGKKEIISEKKYAVGMWYTRVSGSFSTSKRSTSEISIHFHLSSRKYLSQCKYMSRAQNHVKNCTHTHTHVSTYVYFVQHKRSWLNCELWMVHNFIPIQFFFFCFFFYYFVLYAVVAAVVQISALSFTKPFILIHGDSITHLLCIGSVE